MVSHPNRPTKDGTRKPGATPTPAEIREARDAAGLTQTEAARLIYSTLRAWQEWETEQKPDSTAGRRMHPGLFELFQLKTGQAVLKKARRDTA